jgi:predicted porin
MKKSLLALAILGAFAGVASAQTSITLYGVVDGGIAYEDNGTAAGSVLRVENGGQSTSRFGFKGTEDLGGGLSALFVLENGFLVGTGAMGTAGVLFDRQSWVGLKGGYGTFRLGRQETLVYAAFNKGFDPFGRGLAGNIDRMFLIGGSGKRANNTITYTTPTFGGFSGDLAYTMGGVAGDTSQSRELGLSAQYIQGPFGVIYAHHNANSAAPIINAKTNFLAGTYDFKVAKAYLAYGDNKNDSAAVATKIDTRNWLIGVSVPVGPHLFMADYIRKTDKAVVNRDARQIAIGYTYNLSKRTNFYTSYSHTKNDSAGLTNVVTAGASDKLFNAGIRHTF